MRRTLLTAATALCAAAMVSVVQAQPAVPVPPNDAAAPVPQGIFDPVVSAFAPLKFSGEARSLGAFSTLGNGLFKPEGEGPFPSIVVVPSCGGVNIPSLRERAKELLDAGYQVLLLDSFVPRGQKDCRNGVITSTLVWRDALDALAHLQTVPGVDTQKIYLVGYSLGSFAAAALASPAIRAEFKSPHRFRAMVGWYGSCAYPVASTVRPSYFLRTDTDSPVLLLMAEGDRETPIRPFCFPLLDELKAAGKPVEWHLYGPSVTHAWDVRGGYNFTTPWGYPVKTQFDGATTADATQRTLAFLRSQP